MIKRLLFLFYTFGIMVLLGPNLAYAQNRFWSTQLDRTQQANNHCSGVCTEHIDQPSSRVVSSTATQAIDTQAIKAICPKGVCTAGGRDAARNALSGTIDDMKNVRTYKEAADRAKTSILDDAQRKVDDARAKLKAEQATANNNYRNATEGSTPDPAAEAAAKAKIDELREREEKIGKAEREIQEARKKRVRPSGEYGDVEGLGDVAKMIEGAGEMHDASRDADSRYQELVAQKAQLEGMTNTGNVNTNNLGGPNGSQGPATSSASTAPGAAPAGAPPAGAPSSGSGNNSPKSNISDAGTKTNADVSKGDALGTNADNSNKSPRLSGSDPNASSYANNGSAGSSNKTTDGKGNSADNSPKGVAATNVGSNGLPGTTASIGNLSDELKKRYGANVLDSSSASRMMASNGGAGGTGGSSGGDSARGGGGSAGGSGGEGTALAGKTEAPGTTDFTSIGGGKEGNLKISGSETDAEIAKLMAQMNGDGGPSLSKADQARMAELEREHPEIAQMLKESGLTPAEQAERVRTLGDAMKPLFGRVRESLNKCLVRSCVTGKNKLSMF